MTPFIYATIATGFVLLWSPVQITDCVERTVKQVKEFKAQEA